MSKYRPRAEMTPEQSARARRDAKRRKFLVQRGTPSRSRNISEVQRHVRRLYYDGGMTSRAMAAQSGVSRDTIMQVIKGYRVVQGRRTTVSCLLQSTIDKLSTIRLELAPPEDLLGAHIPPTGTRRRLQALSAMGYDSVWMAERLGTCAGNIGALIRGHRGRCYVYAATARRVRTLYATYQHVDPAETGRSAWHISTAKSRARKQGYAPPWCWDEETIDDPHAEPEWTGACGTSRGHAIHRREQIATCGPCREAKHNEADEPKAPVMALSVTRERPARRGTTRPGKAAAVRPAEVRARQRTAA
ncbi:hypothetical protein [Streptomyces sp. NBC_00096]|uniref:hypothetical protein n=1 Tax=Streptomyces sp. NBC_00096 TaxID=2975650 RepID=UPI0032441265